MAKGRATKKKGIDSSKVGLLVVGGVVVLGIALFLSGPSQAARKRAVTVVNDQQVDANETWAVKASASFEGWTLQDVSVAFRGIKTTDPKVVGFAGAIQRCEADTSEGKDPPKKWDGRKEHPACFEDAIYDAKNCSSSYAIAAASALGQRFCIATRDTPLKLSPQQVLSCDKKSKGCNGGGVDLVFSYLESRGLYPEACLPYAGTGGKDTPCKTDCKESEKRYSLSHCRMTSEDALKREIATNGPVVAPMLVSDTVLVYGEGVYTLPSEPSFVRDSNGNAIHVAISILGWGKDKRAGEYWLIANSWGTDWGDAGYAKVSMARGLVLARQAVVAMPGTPEATKAKIDAEKAAAEAEAEVKVERVKMKERVKQRQADRKAKGIEDPSVERASQRRLQEEAEGVIFSDDEEEESQSEDDEEEELG